MGEGVGEGCSLKILMGLISHHQKFWKDPIPEGGFPF